MASSQPTSCDRGKPAVLKTIQVVDHFAPEAVSESELATAGSSWEAKKPTSNDEIAPDEVIAKLRAIAGLPDRLERTTIARMVRLACRVVDQPIGDGPGWLGIHFLGWLGPAPEESGFVVMRRVEGSHDRDEWEDTLYVPVVIDRLICFRRTFSCGWTGDLRAPAPELLARVYWIPDDVPKNEA